MKKVLLLSLIATLLFSSQAFSAVTTADGSITLDFYEDTQSGIDNRWVFDFNANDVDGAGGLEIIGFYLMFLNEAMDFTNQYNDLRTDYYRIGYFSSGTIPLHEWPLIATNDVAIPVGESFSVYATPTKEGDPVIGDFWVRMRYSDNLGNIYREDVQLSGPIDFSAVPEPLAIILFVFGSFFLKFFIKRK